MSVETPHPKHLSHLALSGAHRGNTAPPLLDQPLVLSGHQTSRFWWHHGLSCYRNGNFGTTSCVVMLIKNI